MVRSPLRVLVAVACVILTAQPAAAESEGRIEFTVEPVEATSRVVEVLRGRPVIGGCELPVPRSTRQAGAPAVYVRQLWVDVEECTTGVETLELTDLQAALLASRIDGHSIVADRAAGRPDHAGSSGDVGIATHLAASASYYVWWEDVVNIMVNRVIADIDWKHHNSGSGCVDYTSGRGFFWYKAETGWVRNSANAWYSESCTLAKVWADAVYSNSRFCSWTTVTTHYDNVTVAGDRWGGGSGWVVSTWTDPGTACPKLHYHTLLWG